MFRIVFCAIAAAAIIGCSDAKKASREFSPASVMVAEKQAAGKDGARSDVPELERKIIYTARVELHIKNIEDSRSQLDAIIADVKGYVSKSDEHGRSGAARSGTWKIRVPVSSFQAFLTRVEALGELISKTSDAQDVTEEFVDTEARLKNLKAEEIVLNKLLAEKAQNTADLLAFRQQITSVRESIERLQARLNTLSRLTAMTTIDVVLREDRPFMPESKPTFSSAIGRTFGNSLESLTNFGKGIVLFFVAIAPWLPIIVFVLWLVRHRIRSVVRALRGKAKSEPA